jgi:hypothetical protein
MRTSKKKCNTQKQLSKKKTKTSKKNINNLSKSSKTQLGGILNIDKTKIKYLIEYGKKSIENNREYLYNLLINDKLFEIINIKYSDKQIEHIFNLFVNNNYEEAIEYFDKNYIDKINKYFDSVEDPIIKTVFPNNDELQTYIKTINLDSKLAIKLLWLSIIYHFAFQSEIFDKDMNEDTDQIKVNSYKEELDLQKSSTNTYSEIAKPILVNGGGFTSIRKSVKHNNKYSYKKYIGGAPPLANDVLNITGIQQDINTFTQSYSIKLLSDFYPYCCRFYNPTNDHLNLIKEINKIYKNKFLDLQQLMEENLKLQEQEKLIIQQTKEYDEAMIEYNALSKRLKKKALDLTKTLFCCVMVGFLFRDPVQLIRSPVLIVSTLSTIGYEFVNEYRKGPPAPPLISTWQAGKFLSDNLHLISIKLDEIKEFIQTTIRTGICTPILNSVERLVFKLNETKSFLRDFNNYSSLFINYKFNLDLWYHDFDLTNCWDDELNTIIPKKFPRTLQSLRNVFETVLEKCLSLAKIKESEVLVFKGLLEQITLDENEQIKKDLKELTYEEICFQFENKVLPIVQKYNDQLNDKVSIVNDARECSKQFHENFKKLQCNELSSIYWYYLKFEKIIFTINWPEWYPHFDNKLIYITKLSYQNMELVRHTFYEQAKKVGITEREHVINLLNHCVNPDLYKKIISILQQDADRISGEYLKYINLYIIFNNLENYHNNIRYFILVKIQEYFQVVLQTPDAQRRMRENLVVNAPTLMEHFDLQRRNVERTHEEVLNRVNSWCSSLKADQRIGDRRDIDIIANHLLLQPEFKHYDSRIRKLLEIHNNNYFIVKRQLTEEIKLKNINRLSDEFLNEIVTKYNNDIEIVKTRIEHQNILMQKSLVTREAAEQLLVESSGNLDQALIRIHGLGLIAQPQTPLLANAANAQFQAVNRQVDNFLNH